MLKVSLGDAFVHTMGDEIRGRLSIGIDAKHRVTKRPLDIFHVQAIRDINAKNRRKKLLFIIMVRNPMLVVTSRHQQAMNGYLIGYDKGGSDYAGLAATHKAVMKHRGDNDCVLVKYEELVVNLDGVEQSFRKLGIPLTVPLRQFEVVPQMHPGENVKLNRPLNTARLWIDNSKDCERVTRQFEECPYLYTAMSDFGYEDVRCKNGKLRKEMYEWNWGSVTRQEESK
jgi:hypothetical protein